MFSSTFCTDLYISDTSKRLYSYFPERFPFQNYVNYILIFYYSMSAKERQMKYPIFIKRWLLSGVVSLKKHISFFGPSLKLLTNKKNSIKRIIQQWNGNWIIYNISNFLVNKSITLAVQEKMFRLQGPHPRHKYIQNGGVWDLFFGTLKPRVRVIRLDFRTFFFPV